MYCALLCSFAELSLVIGLLRKKYIMNVILARFKTGSAYRAVDGRLNLAYLIIRVVSSAETSAQVCQSDGRAASAAACGCQVATRRRRHAALKGVVEARSTSRTGTLSSNMRTDMTMGY